LQVGTNDKNCSGDIGSFDSFRSKLFAKVISRFKSFSLNEYDLQILSSVFLLEVFKILRKEPKYAKEFVLNYYRKSVQNPGFVGCVGRVKTVATNH